MITLSAPEEEAKLHCQLRWGAMAGFAPPGSVTGCFARLTSSYISAHCARSLTCQFVATDQLKVDPAWFVTHCWLTALVLIGRCHYKLFSYNTIAIN